MSPHIDKLRDRYVDTFARAFALAVHLHHDTSARGLHASNDPATIKAERAYARALERAASKALVVADKAFAEHRTFLAARAGLRAL